MHFWGLPEFPDFQIPDSRKSGNALEIAVFDKLQHIGYISHSGLVTEFDFLLRIFEFTFSWNFQIPDFLETGIWKSGNSGSPKKCKKLKFLVFKVKVQSDF